MQKLLIIEASPRGEQSMSRGLTARFVAAFREHHPDTEVVVRDLTRTPLRFLDAAWLRAYFTPPSQQTPEMRAELALSDELVSELLEADHIVVATPVHNYNVPANLKAWIDHIVRKGKTLGFAGEGLVHGKKATILMASGGVYGQGSPIRDRDIATTYLRLIFRVIGIEDLVVVAGGNAKAVDMGELTRQVFVAKFEAEIVAAASRA